MNSLTLENSHSEPGTIRLTMWDKAGKSAVVDVDQTGKGTKVNSPPGA